MDLRNRFGLHGSYFLGMAGIGFTLPYLPLYLDQLGLTDRAIGIVSTLAALAGLAQFPVGLWSDRIGWRKPFLLAALVAVAASTWFLKGASGLIWITFLVLLFAENGMGRAIVESLSGAEAAALARKGQVGAALGALRFWKPIGIVVMTEVGGWIAERHGVGAILPLLFGIQCLAVVMALLIHETKPKENSSEPTTGKPPGGWLTKDPGLWAFVAAMVLYHAANAPGGVYLGLYMKRELHAPDRMLSHAFAVSMLAWMVVVWPAGWVADRWGRKPLLLIGWTIMAVRLAFVAMIRQPEWIVANQAFDGLGNGLFAVLAAAWVTDRLADPRRSGEAQVIVGSSLVLGSAIGPAAAGFLVEPLGYRGLFWVLAGVGVVATFIVAAFVPETLRKHDEIDDAGQVDPMAVTSDLSTTP